ncbi:MAG: DUF899 domain-containing protein [Deltaproteobacteria bacterium]|nr:MAG: DUF899 domain-containing protein [Deltaproteobacteria bacterium]
MAGSETVRFPNESDEYRAERAELLKAEKELRRRVEEVAARRRRLPLGGELAQNYTFEEGPRDLRAPESATKVRFSQLFEPGKDTLVVYSFMYGPQMEKPCPMCTSMLDALDAEAPHITQRVNLVVAAKSPIRRIREHARSRGWTRLRLVSTAGTTYNRDYHGEAEDGGQIPSLNVFVRRGDKIHHFYNSELLFAETPEGQDPRHVDPIWPLWNLFDFTPEGRGKDWYPKLAYGAERSAGA